MFAASAASSRSSALALAALETHLPNALRLLAFVPYFALKAFASSPRSWRQLFTALRWSLRTSAASFLAEAETHLPKALACFLPVPYFAAKAAASAARSARHPSTVLARSALAALLRADTHLPKALLLDVFVP